MDEIKIISKEGVETNVNGLLYVYNSKYYFIYTNKELDENGYVKLYVVQVCKEIQNTPNGHVDTGNMIGMEISNAEEWVNVQSSITKIVDDKKNQTQSPEIQYLPLNVLVNLKILSSNKFKLMKQIVEENFGIKLAQAASLENNTTPGTIQPLAEINQNVGVQPLETNSQLNESSDVIIDYRTRFFEEQEKNKELEEKLKQLEEKIENIKKVIE